MINIKDYELIGIFFQGNFKRFQAGELINLGKNYYFDKEKDKEKVRYKLKRNKEKSFDFVLNNSIESLNVDFNIKAIIGNNGAGKSTILEIIQNYYKYPSRLSFYQNYNDNSFFNIDNHFNNEINIDDLDGEDNLVFVKGSNYDIVYVLLKSNSSKFNTISLNQNILSKNQNYSDFISNPRTFDYLKNTILMKILKVTDSPDKIKRITKVKAYNASVVLNNSKLLLIAQFFIVNDILKKVYVREHNFHFLLDINNETLEFLDIIFKLNLFNPKSDKLDDYDESIGKILVHTYIFNLSVFIRNIMDKNSYENLLTYLLSLFFLYRNLLISEKIFDKHIFNFLEQNLDDFGIHKIHYKNILDDSINNIIDTNRISLSRENGNSIISECLYNSDLSEISYSFIRYLKSYGKYEKISDNDSFRELNHILSRLNRNIIGYINSIFSIKKGSSLVKNYGFIDIDYEDFERSREEYQYYLKSRFNLDLSKFNRYLKDFFIHDIQIKDNDNEFYLSDLSSGEKQIIGIFNFLHKKLFIDKHEIDIIKQGNFNIFIDEPEISLHLEWQRKLIYYLLDGINLIFGDNRKINLYIATHSPFIISDLEKNDVIFLHRDDKNKTYVKNFDEIKKESNLIIDNTFIANIPELIRGPFFLDDIYGELGNEFIKSVKTEKDFKIAKYIAGDKFNFEYLFIKNYKND